MPIVLPPIRPTYILYEKFYTKLSFLWFLVSSFVVAQIIYPPFSVTKLNFNEDRPEIRTKLVLAGTDIPAQA